MEIYHLPAHVLAKKIQEKEISSLEVTETFIERIEKYDHKINAVVVKTFEEAIEAAKSADKDISQNKIKGQQKPRLTYSKFCAARLSAIRASTLSIWQTAALHSCCASPLAKRNRH